MSRILSVVLVAVVMSVCVSGARAAATLPHSEGFESGWSSANPWSDSGSGSVASDSSTSAEGSASAKIDQHVLIFSADDSENYTNIWIQIFGKPVPSEDAPTVSGVSGAWCVTTSGLLRAYTSAGWETVKTGVPTNQWLGFMVHLDYGNTNWDIYYTAGSVLAPMELVNASGMGFPAGYSNEFFTFEIESGSGAAYVDAFDATLGYFGVEDTVESPDEVLERDGIDLVTGGGMAMTDLAQHFCAGNNTLGGPLGMILRAALEPGDRIMIYNPVSENFDIYTAGIPLWVEAGANDVVITATTGFWIDTVTSGLDPLVGEDTYMAACDVADLAIPVATLNGTGKTGWTALAWPFTDTRQVNTSPGFGFATAVGDDAIMIYNTATRQYDMLRWRNETSEWWYQGSAAHQTLSEGQGFWYYRSTVADSTWDAEAVRI